MFNSALCIRTPSTIWSKETIPADGGLISLLIQPLTGYARILDHSQQSKQLEEVMSKGFIVSETLAYGRGISTWRCREALSQILKERRADLECVDAAEASSSAKEFELLRIPRGDEPESFEKSSALRAFNIGHRYLCATIDGD